MKQVLINNLTNTFKMSAKYEDYSLKKVVPIQASHTVLEC